MKKALRWLFEGSFRLPSVTSLEGLFLRLLFALIVAYTLRSGMPFTGQPHPTGLARFFDLTWLSNPQALSTFKGTLYLLLIVYVSGWGLPVVLPVITLGHILLFTLFNSQGYTHHGNQIVSLTLLAQALTVVVHALLRGPRLRPPDRVLDSWLLVQSQVIVTGVYLVSVFSKMINSNGLWLWNANHIAMSFLKTRRQLYLNELDPALADFPAHALWFIEHPWFSRFLFSAGFFLEATAFLAIGNRRLSVLVGLSLIAMHQSISALMGLEFVNNQLMCAVFLAGLPFLLAGIVQRIPSPAARRGLLIGLALSPVIAYAFARPGVSFPDYLIGLVNSLGTALDAEWRRFWTITGTLWMTAFIAGCLGALIGWLAGRRQPASEGV